MSRRAFRPHGEICQLCELITAPRFLARPSHQAPKAINITRTFSSHGRTYAQKNRAARSSQSPAKESSVSTQSPGVPKIAPMHGSDAQLVEGVEGAKKACDIILSLKGAPSELIVLRALDICGKVAGNLVEEPTRPVVENTDGTATSALLSLVNSSTKEVRPQKITPDLRKSIDELSDLVYSVVKHPPVFITPEILKAYVEVQSCLGKPETFPEVLDLYANKPAPVEGTSPVRYTKQNPNKVANAVPADVANRALQTAIDARQLGVTIDIIETTYTTKAFHRAKLVRKALLPGTAALVAPVAAYSVASKLALFQTTMDTAMATNVAFAGLLSYMGFTACIGVVALSTANDQMERVTWAPGMPLRDRWLREEERAAIDRIAVSWGFRESWRRGEEEGGDWDTLREWIGRKGMILDRVELMEGME